MNTSIILPTLDDLESLRESGALSLEPRALTDDERQKANTDRRAKFNVGDESEKRGKGWLERYFRAEVKKCALRSIWTSAGEQFVSSDVDFIMNRPCGDGAFRITKVEVKGTVTDSFPLTRISPRERVFLNRSIQFGYDTWILCLWWTKSDGSRPDCDLMHLITWRDWLGIEADLLTKAIGNFKAKSIRRRVDLKNWDRYAIRKDSQRWMLDPSHWLAQEPK